MTRDTSLIAAVLVILYLARLADEMQKTLPADSMRPSSHSEREAPRTETAPRAAAQSTRSPERDGVSPAREPRRAEE
jgi:hypothetical protein